MTWWAIEPRDPLVVRDGRPNDGRSESKVLSFPFPGTIAGAVRTALGTDAQGGFDSSRIDELLQIGVTGPMLGVREGDAAWRPLLCAPRDALVMSKAGGGERQVLALHPLESAGALSDAGMDGMSLVGLDSDEAIDGKPPKDLPAFWTWEMMEGWLRKSVRKRSRSGDEAARFLAKGYSTLDRETRVHVAIGASGTAEEGKLFATSGLRFSAQRAGKLYDLALLVGVESPIGPPQGLRPLAGERRLARWSSAEVQWIAGLPDWLEASLGGEETAVVVRVALLTPGSFKEGCRPTRILGKREELGASLIAACVGRPETVSGWDLRRRQPKRSVSLASSGSVYWVRLDGPPAARLAWAREVWMRSVSDLAEDGQDQRDGYGLAVIGVA